MAMVSEERACLIVAGKKSLVHITGHAGTDVTGARRKPSHLRRAAFYVSFFFTVRLQPSFPSERHRTHHFSPAGKTPRRERLRSNLPENLNLTVHDNTGLLRSC